METPQIGKNVIESLTLGMYEDCKYIYREYVQNSADSIDKAKELKIDDENNYSIYINIDSEKHEIEFYDNAKGIKKEEAYKILVDVACSNKQRGVDKGFRGIGRLGGLGYCSKLVFETSFKGENHKSILTWNADLLKRTINDNTNKQDAVDVLKSVTSIEYADEKEYEHYFKVTLYDVNKKELLDVKSIIDYLSMVAPVDYSNHFVFRSKIKDYMDGNGFTLDTYNIYVNQEQIYKPYTTSIFKYTNGRKTKEDEIKDLEFFSQKDADGNFLYWGWYSLSELKGQMQQINLARGIRLRKENIQIGDSEICKRFFTLTNDQRFSFYFFGEIHAVSSDLIPNSRRDYFGENEVCSLFEENVKKDFLNLRSLCYDMSDIRKASNDISKANEVKEILEKKEKEGFVNSEEKEKLQKEYEDKKKIADNAQSKVQDKIDKLEQDKSPLLKIATDIVKNAQTFNNKTDTEKTNSNEANKTKTKYITDDKVYSRFDKKERRLIGRIYEIIGNVLTQAERDVLIKKIQEELTK